MVIRKTTARYPARLAVVKAPASSVVSTVKPFSVARPRSAVMPAGMASWRNPAVLEKTSTL